MREHREPGRVGKQGAVPPGPMQDDIYHIPGNHILLRLYPLYVGPLC